RPSLEPTPKGCQTSELVAHRGARRPAPRSRGPHRSTRSPFAVALGMNGTSIGPSPAQVVVDDAVLFGLLGREDDVTVGVASEPFDGLTGVAGEEQRPRRRAGRGSSGTRAPPGP